MHLAARHAQSFKRLRRSDFVYKVAVDIKNAGAVIRRVYDVIVPDFFE
jgi:hypothetical protein